MCWTTLVAILFLLDCFKFAHCPRPVFSTPLVVKLSGDEIKYRWYPEVTGQVSHAYPMSAKEKFLPVAQNIIFKCKSYTVYQHMSNIEIWGISTWCVLPWLGGLPVPGLAYFQQECWFHQLKYYSMPLSLLPSVPKKRSEGARENGRAVWVYARDSRWDWDQERKPGVGIIWLCFWTAIALSFLMYGILLHPAEKQHTDGIASWSHKSE